MALMVLRGEAELRAARFDRHSKYVEAEPLVTFILPTIGRETLSRTVATVVGQTDPRWRLVVAGDGWQPSNFGDQRIRSIATPLTHHESPTMNDALDHVETDWVAFLGDDDALTSEYVIELAKVVFDYDVVIFKQSHPRAGVFPTEPRIGWGNVGASYALRTELARQYPFQVGEHEDLLQLQAIEQAGARIYFSDKITYIARISERPVGNDTAPWPPPPDPSYAQRKLAEYLRSRAKD